MKNATTFVGAVLVFAVSGILVAAAVLSALDEADQQYKRVKLQQLRAIDDSLVRAGSAVRMRNKIVFLGDSLSIGPTGFLNAASWVPTRLREIIERRTNGRNRASVVSLIGSGLTVYSYYFMCDRIIELDPKEVVIEFNLFWLSENWHRTLDRTVFAAWLPLAWWREALTLPLHITSLTTDRWILYRALFKLGLSDAWYRVQREQSRLPDAYWNLGVRIQEWIGSPNGLGFHQLHALLRNAASTDSRNRATLKSARGQFGAAVDGVEDDQFALLVLNAFLRRLENAGIPALVYVPPHNVEHLDELGLLKREGLDRTLSQIEAVVRHRGARFVDLHDQFPDAAFRDYLDHYVENPDWEGSRLIAEKLAPHVLENYLGRQKADH